MTVGFFKSAFDAFAEACDQHLDEQGHVHMDWSVCQVNSSAIFLAMLIKAQQHLPSK